MKALLILTSVFSLHALLTEVAWSNPNDLQWRFSGETNDLRAVAYGNGTIVAVGRHGTVLSSTDTVKWTTRASGTSQDLRGVAYGNGWFVAVGGESNAVVLTSSDNGLSWHEQAPNVTKALHAVTWGHSKFVAVGDQGTILISSNGVVWSKRPTGFPRALVGVVQRDTVYVGSLFLAVGEGGAIVTSPDGLAWTFRTSGVLLDLYCVTALIGRRPDVIGFVAAGQEGVAVTSVDGVTWNAVALPTDKDIYAAVALGASGNGAAGQFTLAGRDGLYLTSNDGISWSTKTSGTQANFRGLSPLDGGVLAVGDQGTIRNGLVWFRRDSGTTSMLRGAAHGAGRYVVVGDSGTVLTSTDGANWTSISTGLPSLNDVVYGAGKYVAVGEGLSIAVSTNGQDWTSTNLSAPADSLCCKLCFQQVAYGNGAFMTAGYYLTRVPLGHEPKRPLLAFSADGLVWLRATNVPAAHYGFVLHPAAGLGQFLLAGASLYSSSDGQSWTERVPSTYFPALEVAPDRAVALSDSSSVAKSTNGTDWDVSTLSPPVPSEVIAFGGGAFVTAWNRNEIMSFATSSDGSDWSTGILFERGLHLDGGRAFVASGDNCFLAGGLGGVILQSSPLTLPPQLRLTVTPEGRILTILSETGKSVSVNISTNLLDWVPLVEVLAQQHTNEVRLSDSTEPSRFYRAVAN